MQGTIFACIHLFLVFFKECFFFFPRGMCLLRVTPISKEVAPPSPLHYLCQITTGGSCKQLSSAFGSWRKAGSCFPVGLWQCAAARPGRPALHAAARFLPEPRGAELTHLEGIVKCSAGRFSYQQEWKSEGKSMWARPQLSAFIAD